MTTELQSLLIGTTTSNPTEHIAGMVEAGLDIESIYADREVNFRNDNDLADADEAEVIALLSTKQHIDVAPTPEWEFEGYESEAAYDAQAYARSRKEAYDGLNQFELMTDDSANGTTTHADAINAIKQEFPK